MTGDHGSAAGAGVQRESCWGAGLCGLWLRATAMASSFTFSSRKAEEHLMQPAAQACSTLGYWRSSWQDKGSDNLSCVSLLLNKRFLACTSSKKKQLPLVMGVGAVRERCSVWACALVRLTDTVYRMWRTSPSLEHSAPGARPITGSEYHGNMQDPKPVC